MDDLLKDFKFKYIGNFNKFPTNTKAGYIIIKNNTTYLFDGNNWLDVGEVTDTTEIPDKPTTELQPIICKCCGAPLHSNICEYCGIEYA